MKTVLFVILFTTTLMFASSSALFGQTEKGLFVDPIEYPLFKNGETDLWCFINQNIDKKKLRSVKKTGVLAAQFVIDSLGQVKDIMIVKSLDSIADNELIRIITLMSKWTPGKQNGIAVNCHFYIPLTLPYKNKFCR